MGGGLGVVNDVAGFYYCASVGGGVGVGAGVGRGGGGAGLES